MNDKHQPLRKSNLHKHKHNLILLNKIYGSFGIVVAIMVAIVSTITVLLSRVALEALLRTILSPVLANAFGYHQDETLAFIFALMRFGPVIIALLGIGASLIIAVTSSIPFFATAYALKHNKHWLTVIMVFTILATILVFPFGTAMGLYSIWYLVEMRR